MRNKTVILLFTALILVQIAQADMISPGMKGISRCYTITNLDQYPDYTFIAANRQDFKLFTPNACIDGFYKLFPPFIFTAKTADLTGSEITLLHQDTAGLDGRQLEDRQQKLADFLQWDLWPWDQTSPAIKNPKLIPSLQIRTYEEISSINPIDSVEHKLTITLISEHAVAITESSIVYHYTDGTSEEKPVKHYLGENPTPRPATCDLNCWTWHGASWRLIPLIAIILIAAILLKRRLSK